MYHILHSCKQYKVNTICKKLVDGSAPSSRACRPQQILDNVQAVGGAPFTQAELDAIDRLFSA